MPVEKAYSTDPNMLKRLRSEDLWNTNPASKINRGVKLDEKAKTCAVTAALIEVTAAER